jgi:hypothetical protein
MVGLASLGPWKESPRHGHTLCLNRLDGQRPAKVAQICLCPFDKENSL